MPASTKSYLAILKMLKVFASWGKEVVKIDSSTRADGKITTEIQTPDSDDESQLSKRRIEQEISNAESVSSELVGSSRTITTITAAFCFVVSEATVSIVLS